nr:hypothetical protein pPsy0479a_00015 [Pseudomonas syringae]
MKKGAEQRNAPGLDRVALVPATLRRCVWGAERWNDGTVRHSKDRLEVLLGESSTSEAWTDGKTYLAINRTIVQRLKSEPMKTAAYIFGLVEHEVAHQGDSRRAGMTKRSISASMTFPCAWLPSVNGSCTSG